MAILKKRVAKLKKLKPLFMVIGEELIASHRDRFKAGVSPEGYAWKPNAPNTIAAWAAYKAGAKTGAKGWGDKYLAYQSIKKVLVWNDIMLRHIFYEATDNELSLYAPMQSAKYASVHQFGTKFIPQRKFLGISSDDRTMIQEEAVHFLSRA